MFPFSTCLGGWNPLLGPGDFCPSSLEIPVQDPPGWVLCERQPPLHWDCPSAPSPGTPQLSAFLLELCAVGRLLNSEHNSYHSSLIHGDSHHLDSFWISWFMSFSFPNQGATNPQPYSQMQLNLRNLIPLLIIWARCRTVMIIMMTYISLSSSSFNLTCTKSSVLWRTHHDILTTDSCICTQNVAAVKVGAIRGECEQHFALMKIQHQR